MENNFSKMTVFWPIVCDGRQLYQSHITEGRYRNIKRSKKWLKSNNEGKKPHNYLLHQSFSIDKMDVVLFMFCSRKFACPANATYQKTKMTEAGFWSNETTVQIFYPEKIRWTLFFERHKVVIHNVHAKKKNFTKIVLYHRCF